MASNPSFSLAVDDQEIVIRVRKEDIDQDALSRFLDYVEFESIRRRSRLSATQAADLAQEIDQAVWKAVRSTFSEA